MRIVLDTNTVVSALFWSGSPRRLLDAIYSGQIMAFTSDELILELEDVLHRAKSVTRLSSEGTTAGKNGTGRSKKLIGADTHVLSRGLST
jgi:putative PIN family toxin of toxin-antitoxin system